MLSALCITVRRVRGVRSWVEVQRYQMCREAAVMLWIHLIEDQIDQIKTRE